ncbi:MAG: hypothetical protein V2B14_04670 [bacterium]
MINNQETKKLFTKPPLLENKIESFLETFELEKNFNRKLDLTYDLERVLSKIRDRMQVES